MGLGALLLNVDESAARLRGNSSRSRLRTRSTPGRDSRPFAPAVSMSVGDTINTQQEDDAAEIVILWPALGCPQLVNPDGLALQIIFFSKAETVNEDYVMELLPHILVIEWESAKLPYNTENEQWNLDGMTKTSLFNLVMPGGIMVHETMGLEEYENAIKERPLKLGSLHHTMAEVVPKVYKAKDFETIACVSLILRRQPGPDGFVMRPGCMYTLFYGPENGLLRTILEDDTLLEKPYDGIPLVQQGDSPSVGGSNSVYGWRYDRGEAPGGSRCGDRNREHQVRLLHPFMVVPERAREYLNVGHMADSHISTLWDFFDDQLFPNYNQDQAEVTNAAGREPLTGPDEALNAISERFNNPNINVRNLTSQLNGRGLTGATINEYVDIILQTGDLIDFNRGFNLNPRHDPDDDYVFNLNWLRYYELLLQDYKRPTFTSLGNHDWRLNPYPPRIKAEFAHFLLLPYLLGAGAAMGAACGLVGGAIEAERDADDAGLIFVQFFLVPFLVPLTLFTFVVMLGAVGLDLGIVFDILFDEAVLPFFLGAGWLLGLIIILIIFCSDEVNDAESGACWGTFVGLIPAGILTIVLLVMLIKSHDYMTDITNLLGDDLANLLDDKNVAYLRAFGKDGVLHMTPRAFDWYALVINPFLDYAFRHGNMFFMLADWAGGEILLGDPPIAADSLTDRQWRLFQQWTNEAQDRRQYLNEEGQLDKEVVPIIGMHTPVFCPMSDVNLNDLHEQGKSIGDNDIARGTMDEQRRRLIDLLYSIGNPFVDLQGQLIRGSYIPAISLAGHSHVYDIFRMKSSFEAVWYQTDDYEDGVTLSTNRTLHITTSCAGPPSDGKPKKIEPEWREIFKEELKRLDQASDNTYDMGRAIETTPGERVRRPAGCRVLTFNENGQLTEIEEISAQTAQWGDV